MSMQGRFEEEAESHETLALTEQHPDMLEPGTENESESYRHIAAMLNKLVESQTRTNRRMVLGGVGMAVVMVTPFALYDFTHLFDSFGRLLITPNFTVSVLALLYGAAGTGTFRALHRLRKSSREAAEQVLRGVDVSCAGALVDVLAVESKVIRAAGAEALCRLLPHLKASNSAVLNAPQKKRLAKLLMRQVDSSLYRDVLDPFGPQGVQMAELQIAILKGFEQIGGAEEIRAVRYLAEAPARSEAGLKVQEAARQCLVYLNERTEQENAARTLLRGSEALPASPAQLLRPAGGESVDADNLVRPSDEPAPAGEPRSPDQHTDLMALAPC